MGIGRMSLKYIVVVEKAFQKENIDIIRGRSFHRLLPVIIKKRAMISSSTYDFNRLPRNGLRGIRKFHIKRKRGCGTCG